LTLVQALVVLKFGNWFYAEVELVEEVKIRHRKQAMELVDMPVDDMVAVKELESLESPGHVLEIDRRYLL